MNIDELALLSLKDLQAGFAAKEISTVEIARTIESTHRRCYGPVLPDQFLRGDYIVNPDNRGLKTPPDFQPWKEKIFKSKARHKRTSV